jgi:hypothetical protein
MMTDDERNKPERMLQNVDGSRNLAHMLKLMTESSSVMDERPDHALLLVEEVYAITCRATSRCSTRSSSA